MLDKAVIEARIGESSRQFPVGCAVEIDGVLVGKGHNQTKELGDPSAHAEIQAIRNACKNLNRRNLSGATVYTTLEPCPMCLYALMICKVDRIIYGAKDPSGGAITMGANIVAPYNNPLIDYVSNEECFLLTERYFK